LDMCSDPHRRSRPDCVALLAAGASGGLEQPTAEPVAAVTSETAGGSEFDREFEAKVRQIHRQMCSEPQRRTRKDCSEFLAEVQSASEHAGASSTAQGFAEGTWRGKKQLHWQPVVAWSAGDSVATVGSTTGHLVVESQELKAARWADIRPKVACISAIPTGQADKDELWKFVRNFYAQDYDGVSQLILVYDYADAEAEALVHQYADGRHILAVPAMDSKIPSATALRFGAWSAAKDTQVVAQWDYGVQHHPQRLDLQVRSLAFSSRPSSALMQLGSQPAGHLQAATLVGEAKWMRRHWHPMVEEEPHFLESLLDDQLVQVHAEATVEPSDKVGV